ncbi:MAG TPA: bifunctional 4-hydroxy-2-oxoglutarate aldolase/2-dehydro-3-deoxy-phosphogluconate aldolase [Planctomycetota bacterium]|nr:bifunctional 4-hydroxy-2-oxoglutarate aldolase/2-dehydro-3-deoxy-phosphogluconate aldolase [Planctomycetota bacterium]
MSSAFSWSGFEALPIVGILRGFSLEAAESAAVAAARGGLTNLEVTWNTPGAAEQVRCLRRALGDAVNVGAGTVLSVEDLDAALGAGAAFIVTPGIVAPVIRAAKERGVPIFPGALTPTEVLQAAELGADLVKVFPAEVFGPAYIQSLKAPLSRIRLMPTGGVTVETLPEYRSAGADAFGVGSPLFSKARMEAGDWAWVEEQARRFAGAFRA